MFLSLRTEVRTEYTEKLRTAEEAVSIVESGQTVYIGTCTSIAAELCRALGKRQGELENVTIACSNVLQPFDIFNGKNNFRVTSYFMGPQERRALKGNYLDFTSVHLSQADIWFKHTAPANIAFIETSAPDEDGNMSLGLSGVAVNNYAIENADIVIVQVNKNVPFLYGESNLINVSQADYIVEADTEISTIEPMATDRDVQTISDFIVEQVPDGACIQLGLGGLSNAIGEGLACKNDLGAHSELMSDSMMNLMKKGVLNNSRKSYMKNKTVAGFTLGSRELYDFVDHNPDMYYAPFHVVNNPINIAKNDCMISINTALSIDLFGQVVADNIGTRQYSATGGQIDFVKGAQLSKGGKSFIAVQSAFESSGLGRQSRIVSQFPPGSAITTPRSEVQYIVTEYGCINLKELNMKDRVRAMISLAHPDYRARLTDEAKAMGIL